MQLTLYQRETWCFKMPLQSYSSQGIPKFLSSISRSLYSKSKVWEGRENCQSFYKKIATPCFFNNFASSFSSWKFQCSQGFPDLLFISEFNLNSLWSKSKVVGCQKWLLGEYTKHTRRCRKQETWTDWHLVPWQILSLQEDWRVVRRARHSGARSAVSHSPTLPLIFNDIYNH